MSYEHCDKHDQDATNGCEACIAERVGYWTVNCTGTLWQLRRNGVLVAVLYSARTAEITRLLWIQYLTHSADGWEDGAPRA